MNLHEARSLGLQFYLSDRPCKEGHVERNTIENKCRECLRLRFEKMRRAIGQSKKPIDEARRLAKASGEKLYNGKPCIHGHGVLRWTYNSACAVCMKLAAEKSHTSEKGKAYLVQWRSRNLDKVRDYNRKTKCIRKNSEGVSSAKDIRNILRLQRFKCAECRVSVKKTYHIDHITPIAKGGTSWPNNLQCLCPPCNMKKGSKDPLDFAREKGRLL